MRWPSILTLVASSVASTPLMAIEGDWSWMRSDSRPALNETVERPASFSCVSEILQAQREFGIPGNLLLAIGLQETGVNSEDGVLTVWPWSANAAGTGRWFDSKADAIAWTNAKLSRDISSVDVGCMQINLRWHPEAFETLEEAFTPKNNVRYAANLLVRLRL